MKEITVKRYVNKIKEQNPSSFQQMKTKHGDIIMHLIVPEWNVINITETIPISDATELVFFLFFMSFVSVILWIRFLVARLELGCIRIRKKDHRVMLA